MGRFISVSFSLLVVFLSLSGTGAGLDCPPDSSSHEGHCYKVFKLLKTWEDAEKFCTKQANGWHLVSIENVEEAEFVAKLVSETLTKSQYNAWIGLRDQSERQGCRLEWSDRGNVKYKALAEESYCLVILTHKKGWRSMTCDEIAPIVCKF